MGAPEAHPIMGPSGSSSHHVAARQDAALRREPPVTHARHCTPLRGRPGAAPIMGPLATTPLSGTSRPALLPDNAPRYGAALEQHPSWGRSPGRRTLARAARHSSGSSSIMGPHARTPHSGPSRPAHTPDSAPHHGAALEQLPSWGRSAISRTLARAARHSRPPVHPERGEHDQNEEEDDAGQIIAPQPLHQRLLWAIGQSSRTSRATRGETHALP